MTNSHQQSDGEDRPAETPESGHAGRTGRRRSRPERPADDIAARFGEPSRAKLEELIAFAQTYRKWTHRELAVFLARDVHNLIPGSGIPKVDLICRLAKALDWPAHAVFSEVCGERPVAGEHLHRGVDDYREFNRAAYAAFTDGRFEDMIALALRMQSVAQSPEERAEGCLREWGGWDGLGRYEQCIESISLGLREVDAPLDLRLRLRANLGFTYFALGRLIDGEGVAAALLERVGSTGPIDPSLLGVRAQALYVRGQCRRVRAVSELDERPYLVASAASDLELAEDAWRRYAETCGVGNYFAMAHTCRGALIANQAFSGHRRADDAVNSILAELDKATSVAQLPRGTWLESYGWWCVFGAEIVLSLGADGADVDQLLGILTNKGHEIAEHSENWALRERMLTIEYVRHTRREGRHTSPEQSTLDSEDVQAIAGVMARFPAFRPLGWELIRRAPTID